jgi:hypothetical protein
MKKKISKKKKIIIFSIIGGTIAVASITIIPTMLLVPYHKFTISSYLQFEASGKKSAQHITPNESQHPSSIMIFQTLIYTEALNNLSIFSSTITTNVVRNDFKYSYIDINELKISINYYISSNNIKIKENNKISGNTSTVIKSKDLHYKLIDDEYFLYTITDDVVGKCPKFDQNNLLVM